MMLKNKKIKKVLTIFQENRRFAENGWKSQKISIDPWKAEYQIPTNWKHT
jgi:hypothetical protein